MRYFDASLTFLDACEPTKPVWPAVEARSCGSALPNISPHSHPQRARPPWAEPARSRSMCLAKNVCHPVVVQHSQRPGSGNRPEESHQGLQRGHMPHNRFLAVRTMNQATTSRDRDYDYVVRSRFSWQRSHHPHWQELCLRRKDYESMQHRYCATWLQIQWAHRMRISPSGSDAGRGVDQQPGK